jgi:hypothetical protein
MKVEIHVNEDEIAKLVKIPIWLQHTAMDKALRSMAQPVARRAKVIAPSSRQSNFGNATQGPTRDKWGKKYKLDDSYQNDSGQEMGVKVIKTKNGAIAYVGAKHPAGNKQQFNQSPDGREVVYWNNRRTSLRYMTPYRFMDRAYFETTAQQHNAFVSSIQSSFGSMNLG